MYWWRQVLYSEVREVAWVLPIFIHLIVGPEKAVSLAGAIGKSYLYAEIDDWNSFLSAEDDDIDILRKKIRVCHPCGTDNILDRDEKLPAMS